MIPILDHALLRTFVIAAETGSLTRAGERLRLSQPAVSLQMKRLEEALGCSLIERSPRRFKLTGEGEMLLAYGRRILALSDEVMGRLSEPEMTGTVRLGTPEDFATTHLPEVLSAFARAHPNIGLEVTTDLTMNLLERFGQGEFDLVLIKREPMGPSEGVKVWREKLVWVGTDEQIDLLDDHERTIPLVVSPHPCVYRKRALKALDEGARGWRIAYTSTSLAGLQAAVRAGLGICPLPAGMVPQGLAVAPPGSGMPGLPEAEIALMRQTNVAPACDRLAGHIIQSLDFKH